MCMHKRWRWSESRPDRTERFLPSPSELLVFLKFILWQVILVVYVTHCAERSRNHPHKMVHHISVYVCLPRTIRPFQKRFSSPHHYALTARLEARTTGTRIVIYKGSVIICHYTSPAHQSHSKQHSSNLGCKILDLFSVRPMALHCTTSSSSTFY